jgi:hypothetical protein
MSQITEDSILEQPHIDKRTGKYAKARVVKEGLDIGLRSTSECGSSVADRYGIPRFHSGFCTNGIVKGTPKILDQRELYSVEYRSQFQISRDRKDCTYVKSTQ